MSAPAPAPTGRPHAFYSRLLRLRTLAPTTWQRALFVEGAAVLALLIVLADLASAWLLLVLPLAVAAAVKFQDVIATALRAEQDPGSGDVGPARRPGAGPVPGGQYEDPEGFRA